MNRHKSVMVRTPEREVQGAVTPPGVVALVMLVLVASVATLVA